KGPHPSSQTPPVVASSGGIEPFEMHMRRPPTFLSEWKSKLPAKSDSASTEPSRGTCMSKMIELVEEMRARLNQITDTEQALVRAIGAALSRVDNKLLQDVRNITTDHESRRGAILHELQTLASRIGAFPGVREPVPGLPFNEPPARPIAAANGNQNPITRGDWRQAANNIEEVPDIYFKERTASH